MPITFHPIVKPIALQNLANGDIPTKNLKVVTWDNIAGMDRDPSGKVYSSYLFPVAADWFDIMRAEFYKANANRILSWTPAGLYRSYAQQLSGFLATYEQVTMKVYATTLVANRRKWVAFPKASPHYADNPSDTYWRKKVLGVRADGTPVYGSSKAVPSTSNHGEGLAIDLAIGYPPQAQPLGTKDRAWLEANINRFGFTYESLAEPWHVTYYVGDDCPSFVNEPR